MAAVQLVLPVLFMMLWGGRCEATLPLSGGKRLVYPQIEGLTNVQSLDVATDGSTIHALLVGEFGTGSALVNYVSSNDGGLTWTQPVTLNPKDAAPVNARRGNDAQLAARGKNLLAVWQAGSELPGAGPMVIALSRDGGRTWSRGEAPAAADGLKNQSHMDVAADESGHFHLVWLDDREENGNAQGLRYARSTDQGQHWHEESTIDGAVCTCCWNRLVVLPDRMLGVLYRDREPHDMGLALSAPGRPLWQRAGVVGDFDWRFTGCPHCGGGLAAVRRRGSLTLHSVVWTGKESAAGLYYMQSGDHGRSWSLAMRISDGQSREADVATSGVRVGIVYAGATADGSPIYFMQSPDNGRSWSKSKLLTEAKVEADHPRILAIAKGLRAFWTETRAGGGKVWAMASLD